MGNVAVVTGASSGIGYAVSKQLLSKGYRVYGLSRRGKGPDDTIGIAVDIADETAVREAVDGIVRSEGSVDILVNNAGMGISGPVEFSETDDVRRIMDVDFMGQFFAVKAVLPYMRERRSGTIVFTTSVAAPIAIPYQAFYSAAKAAVNAMAFALRNEVRPFGIKVTCVMPGDARTGFTDARKKQSAGDKIYGNNASAVAAMEKDERGGMTPDYVAKRIVKAALKREPAVAYTVGPKYKALLFLFKLVPAGLAYRIVYMMYR